MKRLGVVVTATVFAFAAMGIVGPTEAAEHVASRVSRHIAISAPSDVVEGNRYDIAVRVPSPKKAVAVTIEYQKTGHYSFETVSQWTVSKTIKVRGRASLKVSEQADGAREYMFRALVTYRGVKRSVVSATVRVNYWHWQGLSGSYYHAGSAVDWVGFAMAGRSTQGWHLLSGASGENRYTMSGRCRAFHATVGLTDDSADGSTGTITFSTIDSTGIPKPIWTSPTLVPGKSVPVSLSLASPYRFSILGENTSMPVASGATMSVPKAQPAVSDPEFLCHVD